MPLVINALRGGHTHTHTHTYRRANQSNFKKPGARGQRPHAPGLKSYSQESKKGHAEKDVKSKWVAKASCC